MAPAGRGGDGLSPLKGLPVRRPLQPLQVQPGEPRPLKRLRRDCAGERPRGEPACRAAAGGPAAVCGHGPPGGAAVVRAPAWALPELALLEVLSWLGTEDLVAHTAPVSVGWNAASRSRELWVAKLPHVRLHDRLLQVEKGIERRSRGKLFKCRQLGTGEAAVLRVLDLETINAGQDDGVPTSFLREVAALSRLSHPNVQRHFGAELLGRRALICTEFVHDSFAGWMKGLGEAPVGRRAAEVGDKFGQLLAGLAHAHSRGVIHRNLKPDNVFVDEGGVVKLGDFAASRSLELPLGPCTPENPKERERSGREVRRLWYRAPELILRTELYGPEVDVWSAGCLLAEAATGKAAFPSEGEIDHLFQIFRLLGTPTKATWPEALTMKHFSPKFPMYSGFDLAAAARAACLGSAADLDALRRQAEPDRGPVLENLLAIARAIGVDGTRALSALLTPSPARRPGAAALLRTEAFFRAVPSHASEARREAQESARSPPPAIDEAAAGVSAEVAWSLLGFMQEQDQIASPAAPAPADPPAGAAAAAAAPAGAGATLAGAAADGAQGAAEEGGCTEGRQTRRALPATVVDFMAGLANTLELRSATLHLAACVAERYLGSLGGQALELDGLYVLGATSLKVADVFAEPSKEYYKQENAAEYALASRRSRRAVTAEDILSCERDLLQSLGFGLALPTVDWFVRSFLGYAGLAPGGRAARVALFASDLSLLDPALRAYAHSQLAQCVVVLAAFLAQGAGGAGSPESTPRGLESWNLHMRERACAGNSATEAVACMRALARTLTEVRHASCSAGLGALETRHAAVARSLVLPGGLPVTQLARLVLPAAQQRLLGSPP